MEFLSITTHQALILALVVVVVPKIWKVCWIVFWRPFILSRYFKRQGVSGPGYKILYGNLGDINKMKQEVRTKVLDLNSNHVFPRIFPHYYHWMSQYGETFLYWNGTEPTLCISDPKLTKQILGTKFGFYEKPFVRPEIIALIGRGLPFVSNLDWVRHRRILNPAFSIEKLKGMTKVMADCTIKLIERWNDMDNEIVQGRPMMKLDMSVEFLRLSADIIASTLFGSNYDEGIEAFKSFDELQKYSAAATANVFIPGFQYLPTRLNLKIWKLDNKVKQSLKKIIDARLKSSESEYAEDLLGLMLKASKSEEKESKMSMDEIVEECRTFVFAGHESTSNLLTWTMMLLCVHQDWQEKLRNEVFLEHDKTKIPDADTLSKFKLMNMVVMEALRLYSPALYMPREAQEDIKLGELNIPKGTCIAIPLSRMHHDKELWGDDVDEFKPLRFANGVSKAANHPNALLAFSFGPRVCIGQNFAMMEAKTILSIFLQRFRFSLASEYKHAPIDYFTLQPQFGLPVLLQPL